MSAVYYGHRFYDDIAGAIVAWKRGSSCFGGLAPQAFFAHATNNRWDVIQVEIINAAWRACVAAEMSADNYGPEIPQGFDIQVDAATVRLAYGGGRTQCVLRLDRAKDGAHASVLIVSREGISDKERMDATASARERERAAIGLNSDINPNLPNANTEATDAPS